MKNNFMILMVVFLLLFSISALQANPVVKISTSMGDIIVELDNVRAPGTVDNFMKYVKDGYYDGTIFHRVINNFMIQGGGFEPGMTMKKCKYSPIKNEADNGLKNLVGTIAMARTNDPHSATSQFFINVNDNNFLNFKSRTVRGWGYAVFGKVIKGMDVVNKIKAVKTGIKGRFRDVPTKDIIIKSIKEVVKTKKSDNKVSTPPVQNKVIKVDQNKKSKSTPELQNKTEKK